MCICYKGRIVNHSRIIKLYLINHSVTSKFFNVFKIFNTRISPKDLSIIIAHAIDYFDTALYGFLAPILAPIFFPDFDPIVQLILAYSTLASSTFTRPLGAIIFGLIARKWGPFFGLSYSLIGMACSSVLMCFLPAFTTLGWISPLLLIITRMLRGFFAAGEGTIAKLYVLEDKTHFKALNISHLYQSAAMLGMVLASIAATIVMSFPENSYLWRLFFCLSALTGIMGYLLRQFQYRQHLQFHQHQSNQNSATGSEILMQEHKFLSNIRIYWRQRFNIFRVALITSLSYITYVIPFVFMNSFIPLVTDISLKTMTALNILLTIFDMVMIPIIGRFLQNFEGDKIMMVAALILTVSIIPLFYFLPDASLIYVTIMRIWIVFWGIVFLCPMNVWLKNLFVSQDKYLLVGIGTSLGAGTLGRFTPAICLGLWQTTKLTIFPAIYLSGIIFLVVIAITSLQKRPLFSYLKLAKIC